MIAANGATVAIASLTVARKAGSAIVELLALDEHDLRLRVGLEAGLLENLVGLVGLADVGVLLVDLLRADRASDGDGDHDESEPPEHGGLPMTRTPATHPGRDVVRLLQR